MAGPPGKKGSVPFLRCSGKHVANALGFKALGAATATQYHAKDNGNQEVETGSSQERQRLIG